MSELEDLGRYHQLADAVRGKVNARDALLYRASRVLAAAAETAHTYRIGAVGRQCNFEAVERLIEQAKTEHQALIVMIDEMNVLAPIVNKPGVRLD